MSKADLGINYPWFNYGFDFGAPPQTKSGTDLGGGTLPTWKADINDVLATYSLLGFNVVRWFILGDGWNLPTVFDSRKPLLSAWTVDFTTTAFAQARTALLKDFEALLSAFDSFNARNTSVAPIQLMPVFLTFGLFSEPELLLGNSGVKNTPALSISIKAINKPKPGDFAPKGLQEPTFSKDPADVDGLVNAYFSFYPFYKRDPTHMIDWKVNIKGGKKSLLTKPADILNALLDPLLEISSKYDDSIYAWDICNEPDVALQQGLKGKDAKNLDQLMSDATIRVLKKGIDATIGFSKRASLDNYLTSTRKQQFNVAARNTSAKFVSQFHYYPDSDGQTDKTLTAGPNDSVILGECAISGIPWPSEQTFDLTARIAKLSKYGFLKILLWSHHAGDKYSAWDSTVWFSILDS